jgi:hypothetical protein
MALVRGGRALETFAPSPLAALAQTAAASPPPQRPGARQRAGAVVSGVERGLYMVGGEFLPIDEVKDLVKPPPTREVWHFNLDNDTWTQMFTGVSIRPEHVLAVTFDYRHRRLLVLDELLKVPTIAASSNPILVREPGALGPQRGMRPRLFARLLSFDLESKTSTLLQQWERTDGGFFDRIFLTALEDGSVLLTGVRGGQTQLFRFQARHDPPRVTWSGFETFSSPLTGAPVNTDAGVVLPLGDSPAHQFLRVVDPSKLGTGRATGPSSM